MSSQVATTILTILSRIVVPLWIFTGATFKLGYHTPRNLPPTILQIANDAEIHLYLLLGVLVFVEYVAVGLMLFVRQLAAPVAMTMLTAFCVVLVTELVNGNFENCGCFGDLSVSPWIVMTVDVTLLAAITFLTMRYRDKTIWPFNRAMLGAAAAWALAGAAATGIMLIPETRESSPEAPDQTAGQGETNEQQGTPKPAALPSYYLPQTGEWIDKPIGDTDIARFIADQLPSLQEGRQYLILYSRSCDHCQALLESNFDEFYFSVGTGVKTTLYGIPERKSGFETGKHLNMQFDRNSLREFDLPVGVEWIITPPLVIALEDGIVKCATQSEDAHEPQCLIWH